jgi:hypothetical protein
MWAKICMISLPNKHMGMLGDFWLRESSVNPTFFLYMGVAKQVIVYLNL